MTKKPSSYVVFFTPVFLHGFLHIYSTTTHAMTRADVAKYLFCKTPVFMFALPTCILLHYTKDLVTFCKFEIHLLKRARTSGKRSYRSLFVRFSDRYGQIAGHSWHVFCFSLNDETKNYFQIQKPIYLSSWFFLAENTPQFLVGLIYTFKSF